MAYEVELTDTFGGEANYSWVRRATVGGRIDDADWTPAKEQRVVMLQAKREMGLTGVRGTTTRFGDGYEFRPYGMCQVMFVQWTDQPLDTPQSGV